MAEEVKVQISAQAELTPLQKMEEELKRIDALQENYNRKAAEAKDSGMHGQAKEFTAQAKEYERMGITQERAIHAERRRLQKDSHAADVAEAKRANFDRIRLQKELSAEEGASQRMGRAAVRLGTVAAQGGNPASAMSSMLLSSGGMAAGLVGVAALAGGSILRAVTEDIWERRGIELRDQAERKINARSLAKTASWRGTSSQARQEYEATLDRMAEREANRPELARQNERMWYNPLRYLDGKYTWEGQRKLDENDKAQNRDRVNAIKQQTLTREKFLTEDGGIEMDLARHRAERTIGGQRAAVVDEAKMAFRGRYRQLRERGANPEEAFGTATLEAQTQLRDRQIAAGSGLVNARSGRGDIAAAARWAGESMPVWGQMLNAFRGLSGTVEKNSREYNEMNSRLDQSVK